MQKRCNSIANALGLCLFCFWPLIIWYVIYDFQFVMYRAIPFQALISEAMYMWMAERWSSKDWWVTGLTHWGRVTHICISNLTIIGPDDGLSPGWRQDIIWTDAGILLIGPWGTNFSEILIGIQTFSFKKIHLKMLFVKQRPFCLGLNVLNSLPISL